MGWGVMSGSSLSTQGVRTRTHETRLPSALTAGATVAMNGMLGAVLVLRWPQPSLFHSCGNSMRLYVNLTTVG